MCLERNMLEIGGTFKMFKFDIGLILGMLKQVQVPYELDPMAKQRPTKFIFWVHSAQRLTSSPGLLL